MRTGISVLKDIGLFSTVAKDGLPIATAVAVGVTPRAGTDVASLPDPLPLSVALADHRAGESGLFVYPWCSSPRQRADPRAGGLRGIVGAASASR